MSTMDVSVVLRLIDDLTGPARNASRSIEDMQKRLVDLSRKGAGAADDLPKSLQRAAEAARLSGIQIQALTERYNRLKNAIRGMKAAEGFKVHDSWIRNQTSELDRLAAAARRAEQAQVRAARVSARPHVTSSVAGGMLKYGAAYVGAYRAKSAYKTGLEEAFSLQQTKAMLQVGGESSTTIQDVVDQARKMAETNKQYSVAQHAHSILKLRSAVGDMHEAISLAPAFQQANAVLNAAKDVKPGLKNMQPEDQAYDMARALEIKGVTRAGHKAIESYMESMTKAIIGMSGQIDAGDFHNTFKYGRAATRGWSQDFVQNYLPTLMNEFKSRGGKGGGVQGPGNALMSAFSTIVDERIGKKVFPKWKAMGLVGKDGHIVGRQDFIENPYLWFQKYMAEALKKKLGKNAGNESAMIKELGGLFGNRVAAQMAQILTIAKSQFEKDKELIEKASGFEALRMLEQSSPQAAMQGMSAAFKNLMSTFAESGPAMTAINGLSDAMRSMTEAAKGSGDFAAFNKGLDEFLKGVFGSKFKSNGVNDPNSMTPAFDPGDTNEWHSIGTSVGNDLKQFGKDVADGWKQSVEFVKDPLGKLAEAFATPIDALYGFDGALRKALSWIPGVKPQGSSTGEQFGPWLHNFKSTTAPKVPGMFDPTTTVADPSKKAWYQPKGSADYTFGNTTNGFSHKTEHTYGGIGQVPETLNETLKQLPTAAVPDLSDIGTRIMQSISGGMQKSASLVTGQMTSLMASLQAIAAPGINIPIRAETGGVSGAVQGAIQKANAAGKKAGGPVTINVHADPNPHATAKKVQSAFREAVGDHLNDIG